jgi:hypothetical protein
MTGRERADARGTVQTEISRLRLSRQTSETCKLVATRYFAMALIPLARPPARAWQDLEIARWHAASVPQCWRQA